MRGHFEVPFSCPPTEPILKESQACESRIGWTDGTRRKESVGNSIENRSGPREDAGKGPQEMTLPYRKKLIDVGLPLVAINAESAREKSIRRRDRNRSHEEKLEKIVEWRGRQLIEAIH